MRTLLLSILCMTAMAITSWSESVLIVADEWPQMDILEDFLQKEGGYEVTKVEQDKMPESLSSYDGVFMFVHGAMTKEAGLQMIDYTKNGGRLVVMHHGISSKKRLVPEWLDMLGVALPLKENDPKNFYYYIHDMDYYLINLNPQHYITTHKVTWSTKAEYRSSDSPSRMVSYPAWKLDNSEVFINHNFNDGREKTLLCGFKFKNPETGELFMQDRGGWLKPFGKGWVFYFQPGHTPNEFKEPNYCQIILNCLTWKPNS